MPQYFRNQLVILRSERGSFFSGNTREMVCIACFVGQVFLFAIDLVGTHNILSTANILKHYPLTPLKLLIINVETRLCVQNLLICLELSCLLVKIHSDIVVFEWIFSLQMLHLSCFKYWIGTFLELRRMTLGVEV